MFIKQIVIDVKENKQKKNDSKKKNFILFNPTIVSDVCYTLLLILCFEWFRICGALLIRARNRLAKITFKQDTIMTKPLKKSMKNEMLRALKRKMVGLMVGWLVSCNHIMDLCCCISTLIRIVSVRALFIKPVRFVFLFFSSFVVLFAEIFQSLMSVLGGDLHFQMWKRKKKVQSWKELEWFLCQTNTNLQGVSELNGTF